jgi:hypothetical protein
MDCILNLVGGITWNIDTEKYNKKCRVSVDGKFAELAGNEIGNKGVIS